MGNVMHETVGIWQSDGTGSVSRTTVLRGVIKLRKAYFIIFSLLFCIGKSVSHVTPVSGTDTLAKVLSPAADTGALSAGKLELEFPVWGIHERHFVFQWFVMVFQAIRPEQLQA
jgi:hypothetical protein